MRIAMLSLALLTMACGPSAAEVEAEAKAQKARTDCGRAYSSSEKVTRDYLYKNGVAEVNFVDRQKYIDKCVELGMSKSELKCLDPNIAEGDACKGLPEGSAKKVKELGEFMMSPMTKKDEKKEEEKPTEKPADAPAAEGSDAAPAEAPAPAE